jgi:hypothetical protein
MKTTLNKIRAHSPCASGWARLLKNLGKTCADDEPLAITTILDSNGVDDALWCLRAVDGHQKEMRLYAVDCARSVQHLMKDARSVAAIDVAERHAHGLATDSELAAAARDAAGYAARCVAWDIAWATAWDAAWDAAGYAAGYAARCVAWDIAWATAWDAAWDAARDAARATAWATAWDAAWDAAWAAAGDAAREVQADLLRIVCAEIEQGEKK